VALAAGGSAPQLLVLRALGLGDFLTSVPALRALRAAHPDAELVLAAPAVLRPLAALAGVADQHLDTPGLGALDWDGPPPFLAVNLHGRGPESHRMLQSVDPRTLVGFECDGAGFVGPPWRPDEHEVLRWCRLLEESLRIPADPFDLRVPAPDPRPGTVHGAVVIHPGAAFPARRWPVDRFADVARWAAGAGHPVVVTGSAGEKALAERVASAAGLSDRVVRAGATDLVGLCDQVARARLVICGDTGIAHLATATGTGSVLLFGPTEPTRWGPLGEGPHTVLWHGDGPGDPWADELDPALAGITPDEVIAAAELVLEQRALAQTSES
jgi:ADP-heptose:LPS heptosyltransferase